MNQRPRPARLLLLLATALCLAPAPAPATLYVTVADGALVNQAELIALAEIGGARVDAARGFPSTFHTAFVERTLKGEAGARLEVRVPGGRSSILERELVIHGAPSFDPGDRVLLFLRANDDGTWRVLHLMQGAFLEVAAGDDAVFVRGIAEPARLVAAGGGEPAEPARHAGRFMDWIRDRVDARPRPADYLVARPASTGGELRASFTHLGSTLLRWFEFDEPGGEVLWYRHFAGQEGFEGGGAAEFGRALEAWRQQSGAPIRLIDAGTTTSSLGFSGRDGQNTILFRDFNQVIGDAFDCASGGVIALGGITSFTPEARSFKDQQFLPIREAEIVINDGVRCFLDADTKRAAEVYTHELGHTLGLGHACGDDGSPACSSSDLLKQAIMRAFVDGRRGAQLGDDDIIGARYLYEPDFVAAPCHLPPGHRKFCKRCGPCGEGQGSCRKTQHCLTGLECSKNVGEAFGMRPRANVCTAPDWTAGSALASWAD